MVKSTYRHPFWYGQLLPDGVCFSSWLPDQRWNKQLQNPYNTLAETGRITICMSNYPTAELSNQRGKSCLNSPRTLALYCFIEIIVSGNTTAPGADLGFFVRKSKFATSTMT